MRAGDVVRVDFGTPMGSEAGFQRPAIVVTANAVLQMNPRTIHVVPITGNTRRRLPSEVPVAADGLPIDSTAQCHLSTTISVARLIDPGTGNVGPASLSQLRSLLADLLDIP